jgi:adenine-specific DNA-methyltransferase
MQNLHKDLEKILLSHDVFKSEDDKILKNKVTELAVANDKHLITLLLKNAKLKKHFFDEIEKGLVSFNKDKFIRFINNKEFLPNSFTAFANKIGLHDGTQYLHTNDNVSLVWPFKDCVLEGGQDKEDQKRSEIFYNETLAPDEIDRLFD